MHLFINGRFLSQKLTGVQRFARETLQAMDELAASGNLRDLPASAEVLVPRGTLAPALRYFRCREVGKLHGHAWEQLELPIAARKGFLVGFAATGPLSKRNQLITVHDAAVHAVPGAYTKAFRIWYKGAIHWLLRHTERTVTVSEFSKREICQYFGADPSRVFVTSEGKEHIQRLKGDDSILLKHGLSSRNYFLAVGSMSAHKNFGIIPIALARVAGLSPSVVIAGASNSNVFGANRSPSHVHVQQVGYVSDDELKTLLSHALAFIHPSKYEGFGLPPLEAMALGCPVIAANVAAVPEVAGDAALYFDPDDAEGLARQITRIATDPNLGSQLSAAGLARSESFTWARVAEDYWRLLGAQVGGAQKG